MKKLLTFIFVLLTFAMKAQTLHFHQLTVKDGLPHNSIIALGEDAKGNIWVATHGGLLSYDGRLFHRLPFEELPDKRVDRISRSQDGTMWVQCFERHELVSRYDTLTNHFVTYNVSELSDSIHQQVIQPLVRTVADKQSSLTWMIEKRQLIQTDTLKRQSQFVYSGKTALEAGLRDETFYSLLLDRDGILWVGSANNGLFYADTRRSHYHRLICQPSPSVRAILKDAQGTLWIAISDMQLLTLEKDANDASIVGYPMTDSLEGRRIRAFAEDSKQRIWMGTHDGLFVKETQATEFQRVALNDTSVAVYCLYNDDNRQLWIGTNKGLFSIALYGQQTQATFVDSTITSIGNISADGKGLWISKETGLYYRTDNKTEPWSNQPTHAVVTDGRGQTWAGTDNGLVRITQRGVEPVSTAADGHTVKGLICWRDFLWCSYEQGVCVVNIYTGQSTILRTEHNEYLSGAAFIDTHTGTLYFGGTMGIDCFNADSLEILLRSGMSQIRLEEVTEEIEMKSEEPDSPIWPYIVLVIAVGSLRFGYSIYRYRKRELNQEDSLLDSSQDWGDAPVTPKEPSQFIIKATAIAKAHIADADFTAEQMAQEMAMSRTKLFSLMKNETGKAVMEFVRDIRLEYAAHQLAEGTPVSEIYMACGFSDPSSFRRSFAKKYGANPSQYKNKQS